MCPVTLTLNKLALNTSHVPQLIPMASSMAGSELTLKQVLVRLDRLHLLTAMEPYQSVVQMLGRERADRCRPILALAQSKRQWEQAMGRWRKDLWSAITISL